MSDDPARCFDCGSPEHTDPVHRMVKNDEIMDFGRWAVARGWEMGIYLPQACEVLRLSRTSKRKGRRIVCIYFKRGGSPYATSRGPDAKRLAREWCAERYPKEPVQ